MTTANALALQQAVLALAHARSARIPQSTNYAVIADEAEALGCLLRDGMPIARDYFDGLRMGTICARELEENDDEVCAAVYALLDAVDPDPDAFA